MIRRAGCIGCLATGARMVLMCRKPLGAHVDLSAGRAAMEVICSEVAGGENGLMFIANMGDHSFLM